MAEGGSAGGLLMGAVANMTTDLFAGIIADVPFVDVLNTMLDDTLPLTPPEWPEWGNPIAATPRTTATSLAYSPYDNVAAKPYPPILALAGLTDPRVTYWEPAKWVARLRALKTGRQPAAPPHQHGCRPRRRRRPLRRAEGEGDRARLRAEGDRPCRHGAAAGHVGDAAAVRLSSGRFGPAGNAPLISISSGT